MHAAPLQQVDRWAQNRQIGEQTPERSRARRALMWVLMATLTALLACFAAPVALGQGFGAGPEVWAQPGAYPQPAPHRSPIVPQWRTSGSFPGSETAPPADPQRMPPSDFVWSDPCRPDLWIVSSRGCVDPDCPQVAPCCLDYFHQLPNGQFYCGDRGQFQQWLQPGVPVCVVVHGSFSDWPTVREFAVQAHRWIRSPAPHRPLQVVMFTWPSDGPTNYVLFPYDITVLGHRSGQYGLYFAQFIAEIPAGHPIAIFGHSHGVRTAAAGLHALAGGAVDGMRIAHAPDPGNRIRLVSAAGAFDHHWLNPGERYGRALCRVEAVLNLRSRHDCALSFYPMQKLVFGHRTLARAGFTPQDVAALGPLRCKTYEIDITGVIGTHHLWTRYYERPAIARAISPFVYYADANAAVVEESATVVE